MQINKIKNLVKLGAIIILALLFACSTFSDVRVPKPKPYRIEYTQNVIEGIFIRRYNKKFNSLQIKYKEFGHQFRYERYNDAYRRSSTFSRNLPLIELTDMNHGRTYEFSENGYCRGSIDFEFPFRGRVRYGTSRGYSEFGFILLEPGVYEIEIIQNM